MKKKLRELCLNILAHAEIDCEVTINGNGVNCCEASTVARAVMKICDIKITDDEIQAAANELRKEFGMEEE